jgi:hypothetical protein
MNAGARTEGMRALPSVGWSLTQSPPRVFDVRAGVCVCLCACVPACAGAVPPRSAVATTTSRAAGESFPIAAKRFDVQFCAGINVIARSEGMSALPSVCRSLTQSPPRVFDVGPGVCVCLCACVLACAGTVSPRSPVAGPTRQATCESPPIAAKHLDVLFCAGVTAVARTEGVRRWVGPSRSRRHACLTSVPASMSACVRTCLRARAQCRHGRRWLLQHREQRVSPFPPRRSVLTFCFAPG